MKSPDEAVEKVLAGLREVEVVPGFEERMERRVREAAREREVRGWVGPWQWVGVGCVAMLLVGVGVNLRRQGKQEALATNAGLGRVARERAVPDGVGEPERGEPQRLKPCAGLRGDGTTEAVPLSKAGLMSRKVMPGRMEASKAVIFWHGFGRSEMTGGFGTGFPAPPLPLTAQERLLLRAAEGGEPRPVAVLEVSVVPTHDAAEMAEFVEFFEQDRQVAQNTTGESK